MNLMELVHPMSRRAAHPNMNGRTTPRFATELAGPVRSAIVRARQFLLAERRGDGLWVGQEPANSSLSSLLILWLVFAGDEDSEFAQQCAAALLELQTDDGGWGRTAGGVADLSVSVRCYFALKLLGIDPSSERLSRARRVIRQLGGADAADGETRYLLALFGQIEYGACPNIPCRSLLVIRSYQPVCDVELNRGVRELFVRPPREWRRIAYTPSPSVIRRALRLGWKPSHRILRQMQAELTAQVGELRIGELRFDELVWHMIALTAIGVLPESEPLQACQRRLSELVIVDEDANTAWPQRALSPLSDTALVVGSLLASGVSPDNVVLATAMDHMCDVLATNLTSVATADLTNAISFVQRSAVASGDGCALPPAIQVCEQWSGDVVADYDELPEGDHRAELAVEITKRLLNRQNPDGGWGEDNCQRTDCCESEAVVTGTVMEKLRADDFENVRVAIQAAIRYLRSIQRGDGSWSRDPEAADIRATAAAICGLVSAGIASEDEAVAAGVNWLVVHQEADGGWSDACRDDAECVRSSASPTAWAVMALVAAGRANHRATVRGIEFLIDIQNDAGSWTEDEPLDFGSLAYHSSRNHLHSVAGPLLALSRWAVAAISAQSEAANEMSLRLVGVSAQEGRSGLSVGGRRGILK